MGGGGKGGGSSSYVVGHRYYAGLHLAICHGPVDAVTRIIVGERTAWSGSVTSSQTLRQCPGTVRRGFARGRRPGLCRNQDGRRGGNGVGLSAAEARQRHSGLPRRGVDHRPAVPVVGDEPYIKPWSIEARRIPAPAALGVVTSMATPTRRTSSTSA